MSRIILLLAVIILHAFSASAQDNIHRKGGEVIHGKVIEVGLDEIKYRLASEPDGPIYSISKEIGRASCRERV